MLQVFLCSALIALRAALSSSAFLKITSKLDLGNHVAEVDEEGTAHFFVAADVFAARGDAAAAADDFSGVGSSDSSPAPTGDDCFDVAVDVLVL